MKWFTSRCSAVLCAALAAPGPALAAPLYTLTVIGGAGSTASDINAFGQIVGSQNTGGDYHAFFYDGSTVTDLSAVVGARSVAQRLNDSGTIVGTVYSDSSRAGFAYSGGASLALPLSGYSEASGINNAGTIVGGTTLACCGFNAYTYGGGVLTDLGTTSDGFGSYAAAINEAGHVVGSNILDPASNVEQPFYYSGGVMQNLGTFGGPYGHGWAINNHDQVVGEIGAAYVEDTVSLYPRHAFLYEDGVVTDLGVILEGGDSTARDINDQGQIVGATDTVLGRQAFLYGAGSIELLDALIDPALGWTVQEANGINALGQIAGTACKAGLCYAVRLDLAAAVPEPAGVLLFAAGLLAIMLAQRARHRAGALKERCRGKSRIPDTGMAPVPGRQRGWLMRFVRAVRARRAGHVGSARCGVIGAVDWRGAAGGIHSLRPG
jgi:probable HAF family extracellular repeat protein